MSGASLGQVWRLELEQVLGNIAGGAGRGKAGRAFHSLADSAGYRFGLMIAK